MMFKLRAKPWQAPAFAACILPETTHSVLFMQKCSVVYGAQQQETEHCSLNVTFTVLLKPP